MRSRGHPPRLDTLPPSGSTAGGDADKMGWKSSVAPSTYDLMSGELYWDTWQKATMAYDDEAGWYVVSQPERVLTNPASSFTWSTGFAKNLLYTSSSNSTLTLDQTVAKIAPGTVVRVSNRPGIADTTVSVSCGQASNINIVSNESVEFVFYIDGTTGRWFPG